MNCTIALRNGPCLRGVVLALLLAGVMAISSGATAVHASDGGPETVSLGTPMLPQQQESEEREGESELPWLFAVFFITWAAFFAYVFVMSQRQREMRREIEALKRALAERERDMLHAEAEPESRES